MGRRDRRDLRYEAADPIATSRRPPRCAQCADRPEDRLRRVWRGRDRGVRAVVLTGRAAPSARARISRSGSSPARHRSPSRSASATTDHRRDGAGPPIVGRSPAPPGRRLPGLRDSGGAGRPASCWRSAGSGSSPTAAPPGSTAPVGRPRRLSSRSRRSLLNGGGAVRAGARVPRTVAGEAGRWRLAPSTAALARPSALQRSCR
jgi:hypothetical protein